MFDPVIAAGGVLEPPAISNPGGVLSQEAFSTYDLYTPQELVQAFERHGHKPGFRMMLKSMGFRRGVKAKTTGHYEFPWKEALFHVGSIDQASTGPGTDVIVRLSANSMFDGGLTSGGNAVQGSYIIENDILWFKNNKKGFVSHKDTSVIPHRITISPVDPMVDLADAVIAGNSYFISDNAFGEGSALPAGRISRVIKYSNEFQITKAAAYSTGTEMTNQTYFNPIPGRQGSFMLKVKMDTMYRFESACNGALMWGSEITNIREYNPILKHDVSVKGTEGFINFMLRNSFNSIIPAGALVLNDFNNIGRHYEDERINGREKLLLEGYDRYVETENVLVNFLNNDITMYQTNKHFNAGRTKSSDETQPFHASDFAVAIGFYALKKSGYVYNFKQMNEFSYRNGAGADGYGFRNWGITMPLGYTKNKISNTSTPTVGYEYKKLGSYSREQVVGMLNGAGVAGSGTPYSIATGEYDVQSCYFITEQAFHGAVPNALYVQRPA